MTPPDASSPGPQQPDLTGRAREQVDLLVVGGGPAALAAATGYREHGGQGTVLLVSDDDSPPYLRPPLSKDYLRGETEECELAIEPPSTFDDADIELRLDIMVTALDAGERTAMLADGSRITYGTCVLATGAAPRPLPVPGADDPRVAYLRSLDSARTLRTAAGNARSAVVVGSGFIGCEAAASLARRGLAVTVVSAEELPQQARLGPEVGERIAGWLRDEGVSLLGGVEVEAIEDARLVRIAGRDPVRGDLVLVAGGVDPQSTLAAVAEADIEHDRVVVDEHMRTSVPGLLAAGDVAYARNATAGRHLVVEHWGEADAMGGIAGATAAGADTSWVRAPGFWTVVGDHTLKYVAWGDGFDATEFVDHGEGAFTAWYSSDGVIVGVATHQADEDHERGTALVEKGSAAP
ncbi:MAG: NAD(P)/FAD-dependent oxidoreductase [Pseudonocardia sp.]|nr:NAD(P)/FAD-dependent oxidoreductase [Pseudonocardia sp.]